MKSLLSFLLIPLMALPSVALECRPKTISNSVIVSQKSMDTFSYKGSVYRFVYARGQRPNEKIPIIYREQGDSCWVVWADPGGDAVGLSDGVPRPVAIAFSKATIKRMMAKKGETWMLEWFGKRETIAPEDAAALKSLGYPLPDRIKILPWGKPERETLVNEKY